MDETNSPPVPCPRCSQPMRSATVKSAIWRDDRLFLVEDIPARVCDSCIEQFYDEDTSDALRRLTEEGFASVEPKRDTRADLFTGGAHPQKDIL